MFMFHAFLIDCVEKLMQILVWGSILPMNQQYLFGLGFQSASPRITICRNTTRSPLLLFPPFSKLPTTNLSLVRARVSQSVRLLSLPGFSSQVSLFLLSSSDVVALVAQLDPPPLRPQLQGVLGRQHGHVVLRAGEAGGRAGPLSPLSTPSL